jgi:hypothetical protein
VYPYSKPIAGAIRLVRCKRTPPVVEIDDECVCSTAGSSLSLMRRLMYQPSLYGIKSFAFESLGSCGDPS